MRAAVVGCGRMGAHPSKRMENEVPAGWLPVSHVEALRSLPDIETIALCDTHLDSLNRWATHYQIEHTFLNYQQLIKEFRPHLLTVATRTPEKRDILEFAAVSQVPSIYVEKPLARSIEICRSLLNQLKNSGTKIGYGVNRRFHEVYRSAKTLLVEGVIGELCEIIIEHGESQLMWTHPHSFDLILFFAGTTQVREVSARLKEETVLRTGDYIVDSDPVVLQADILFESGVIGKITRSRGLNVRLTGTLGNLTIVGNGSLIEIYKQEANGSPYFTKHETFQQAPKQSATVNAFLEMSNSLRSNQTLSITSDEILTSIQLASACVWSHFHRGQRVTLSEVPELLTITGKFKDLYA